MTGLRSVSCRQPAGHGPLYRGASPDPGNGESQPVPLTAIPQVSWANRAPGPMQTWIRRR